MMETLKDTQYSTWQVEVPNDGGTALAIFKAYRWESGWRIMAVLPKQKVYFELKDLDVIDEKETTEYFINNRLDMDVAKCCRCGSWRVESGYFCPRCTSAIETMKGDMNVGEEYEIQQDGKKIKVSL